MHNSLSLVSQFELLRIRVESALPKPSIIVVSSARKGDGNHLTARGLANSFHDTGYPTLLVNADPAAPQIIGSVGPEALRDVEDYGLQQYVFRTSENGSDCLALTANRLRRGTSQHTLAVACAAFRSRYRYTIIDSAMILEDNLSMLFAVAADAILLTVREGRRVSKADTDLALTMASVNAKLLGVVSISPGTIRADSTTERAKTDLYTRAETDHARVDQNQNTITRQPV